MIRIGRFGDDRSTIRIPSQERNTGVRTTGIHQDRFHEAQVKAQEENPKQGISGGLSEWLRSNDPLEKRVAPVKEAIEALKAKRLAEKAVERHPLQHLADEAKAEVREAEEKMVEASVRAQMKNEMGVRSC